jgi:pyruvate formate lyase activating enzyme
MDGLITQIQRFSIHDGPGIRTTVFLKGCPLACRWCQNPEAMTAEREVLFHAEHCAGCRTCIDTCPKGCFSWRKGATAFDSARCDFCGLCIDRCPAGALRWTSHAETAAAIMKEVLRDRVFYELSGGGVTLSGGEPLRQAGFCLDLLKRAKRKKLHVAIDTSGYVPHGDLERIQPLVDLFLFDIKFIDPALHLRHTGVSNAIILENFRRLQRSTSALIVRIPLIPGLTDTPENLASIEQFVRENGDGVPIEKIPFNPLMQKKYQLLGRIPRFGVGHCHVPSRGRTKAA